MVFESLLLRIKSTMEMDCFLEQFVTAIHTLCDASKHTNQTRSWTEVNVRKKDSFSRLYYAVLNLMMK